MGGEPGSLLVVDDEELNREGLARHLRRHGYEVTVAATGREAIELLGGRRFDLVLLDIMMPGMNGLEVLKFLRRMDTVLDLPIIMVTAKGESEDVVEALELGANDYVTKPLDLPVILARIRTQLGLRQAVGKVTELERKLEARNRELEAATARLATAHSRATDDLATAGRIQQAFRPTLPERVPGAGFACLFRPCGELAGDFVTVFPLTDRQFGVGLLDVHAQGVAAALLSLTASHVMTTAAFRPGPTVPSPAGVAAAVNRRLGTDASGGLTLTLLYGVYRSDTGHFRFVSAGHPGPIHLPRGGEPVQVESSGLPLGVGAGTYAEHEITLGLGDRLAFYTDGITAVRNAEGEHFGKRRLLAAFHRTRSLTVGASLDALADEAEQWRGSAPRTDDLSVLVIERTSADPEQ